MEIDNFYISLLNGYGYGVSINGDKITVQKEHRFFKGSHKEFVLFAKGFKEAIAMINKELDKLEKKATN